MNSQRKMWRLEGLSRKEEHTSKGEKQRCGGNDWQQDRRIRSPSQERNGCGSFWKRCENKKENENEAEKDTWSCQCLWRVSKERCTTTISMMILSWNTTKMRLKTTSRRSRHRYETRCKKFQQPRLNKMQTAVNRLKKKANQQRGNGIRFEGHQSMLRRNFKGDQETDPFNEVVQTKRILHHLAWKRNKRRIQYIKKKVTLPMPVGEFYSKICYFDWRCTILFMTILCSRTLRQKSDKSKHKRSRHRCAVQTVYISSNGPSGDVQKWLIKDAMCGESKCGLLQLTSCRRSTLSHIARLGTPSNLTVSNTTTSASWRRLFRKQKAHCTDWRRKVSDMFEIKKGTKQGGSVSSLLFNTVLQMALKNDFPRLQKKRGMLYLPWETTITTASRICDLLTKCSYLPIFKTMLLQKTASAAQKRWDSKSIQDWRKFSSTKARIFLEKKSRLTSIRSIHSSNRRRPRSRFALGQVGRHSRNTNKSWPRNHISFGIDFAFSTQWSPQRWCYASGTWTLTKEHERMIQSTQRKMLRVNR